MHEIVVGRNPKDLKKFGSKGTCYLGKNIIGSGEYAHLANKVLVDLLRPHIILVCGKRGSGKCVEENTLITLDDGSLAPIKNLESNMEYILGLDDRLKVTNLTKDEFFKRKVDKLLKITLRSGKEIKLTPEHPLLTIKGWKPIQDLEIGSRIATPRILRNFGDKPMKETNIKLLAYLIAEGHISSGYVLFSNMDAEIIEDFKKSVQNFDDTLKIDVHNKTGCFRVSKKERKVSKNARILRNGKGKFAKGSYAPQAKSSIRTWLEDIGVYGKLSSEKFIPEEVFKLPRHQLSIFLNRLFSCDGSIYSKKSKKRSCWQVSYSSSSKVLIKQVHHLLLRFGILGKLRKRKMRHSGKEFESGEIVISGEEVVKFIDKIGFFGEKEEKQKIAMEELKKITFNPNVDTIPKEIWDIYEPKNWEEIGIKLGYSVPKTAKSSLNYSPSREKLLKIGKIERNRQLQLLGDSDIFWDEITGIEELTGEFNVCDISVPGFHNFVANDIIVHNSYSGGVIAEEIALLEEDLRKNLTVVMIDTMGIYWSMKLPNEEQIVLLNEWGLEPKGLGDRVKTYVPHLQKKAFEDAEIPVDFGVSISPDEFSAADWSLAFNLPATSPISLGLQRVVNSFKKSNERFDIDDLISKIKDSQTIDTHTKTGLENILSAANDWGVFGTEGIKVEEVMKPGMVNIFDVSRLRSSEAWSVRNLLVAMVSRKIYEERVVARRLEEMERIGEIDLDDSERKPMVWLIIDEAHQFCGSDYNTVSTAPLLTIVKQGRQPGISFVPMTQMPDKIHPEIISQSDIVVSHRLTSKNDLNSLQQIMQTYLMQDISKSIAELPKDRGSAIVLDDNSERIFSIQTRPRMTWHGGESAVAAVE